MADSVGCGQQRQKSSEARKRREAESAKFGRVGPESQRWASGEWTEIVRQPKLRPSWAGKPAWELACVLVGDCRGVRRHAHHPTAAVDHP